MTMKLTFVGTGVSCGVPVIGHLEEHAALRFSDEDSIQRNMKHASCCCAEAVYNPQSKNKRNNVSLLITLPKIPSEDHKQEASSLERQFNNEIHLLIDCGKTFRNAYLQVLAPLPLHYVDALFLTHGHADAMQCVEEVVQLHQEGLSSAPRVTEGTARVLQDDLMTHIPTFLTPNTLKEVTSVSPQLEERMKRVYESSHPTRTEEAPEEDPQRPSSGAVQLDLFLLPEREVVRLDPLIQRDRLECIDYHSSPDTKETNPFLMYSVPVEHGKNYISLGFVFGTGVGFVRDATPPPKAGSCVVYLSDISANTDVSLQFLRSLVKIDVLVIDLLAEHGKPSPTHYCWDDIFPFLFEIINEFNAPARVYCVGMFCSLEYEESNTLWEKELKEEKEKIRERLEREKDGLELAEREKLTSFLKVGSVKLAYDGQVLELPL